MRIQKYLSENKILSRRETEDYIVRGFIAVNGEVVTQLGMQIDPEKDKVEILPMGLKASSKKMTVAVYKPRGVVSTKIKTEGPSIFDVFPKFKRLNVVGRLDKESEGLLLLSDDGTVTSAVTGNDHLIEKEYEVCVREHMTNGKARKMETGIVIDGKITLPAKVRVLRGDKFVIILREGRKHQIRRMSEKLGLTIKSLKRIRIGNISLGDLKPGESRLLEGQELKRLGITAVSK
jgi:pseudouridine synthase